MTKRLTKSAIALSGWGMTLSLVSGWGMQSWAQSPVSTDSAFLGWLLESSDNQDGNENPRTKRGDDFCLVTLQPGEVNQVWSDRPTFLIQGNPRSLALYRAGLADPIWTYPVNQADTVVYTGPPLAPETDYTLRAEHSQFPSSIYEERTFTLPSIEEQTAIAFALADLESQLRQNDAADDERAIAKADYLWQNGFETDAWATILPLQSQSSEVAAAITTGVDALCNLASTSDSTLE